MTTRKHETDMCSGPLFRNILLFSLPIMAMYFLQLMFNTADMIVVGHFSGSKSLAAVGATGSLINLLVTLFMGLSAGTTVVVAQDFGAGNKDGVSRSVHTSIAISLFGGLMVMLLGLFLSRPLLQMMGTPKDIIQLSSLYMRIYFISAPATMVYNFAAAILRAAGDSKRPMYYLLFTGTLHVIFNLIFVILFHMNVAGVASATVISEYLSVILIMLCLYRSDGAIRFIPGRLRVDKLKLKMIFRIGLPAGIQGMLFSISNVLIQSAINSFGSVMVAASAASGNVENYLAITMNAYYNAAISFTGQNMGAKKYERIDTIAKVCTILIFSTWILLGGTILLLGRHLLTLYTSDQEVIKLGMQRMFVMMAAFFTCGMMNTFPGITRGMGYSIMPMLSTLIGACLMRIVWLFTIFHVYHTETMLFVCYPVTWAIAGIGQVGIFFYARRKLRRQESNPVQRTATAHCG